jgi:hypothetical protein
MIAKTTLTFRDPHSEFRIRKGLSMAEVLVALFLLALGTIAILTMFPLGMYHMGQALKDDRTAQCAQQADQYMRNYWRLNVVENPNRNNTLATGFPGYEPMFTAFDWPDSKPDLTFGLNTPITSGNVPAGRLTSVANAQVPSYPVFVDPMGYGSFWSTLNPSTHQFQFWVAGDGLAVYPRRSLNMFVQPSSPPTAAWRACSMMDGFTFADNGAPSAPSGAVERELRYNWMWILQRPDNTVQNTANMTVVVFDRRAFQYAPQQAEVVFASGVTAANIIVMIPLTTTISVPAAVMPSCPWQKGSWLMDATPTMRHANFYRVVSVTDNTLVNGMWDIELQTPIRRLDGGTGQYAGTLMHIVGVSEVFERPKLTAYDF